MQYSRVNLRSGFVYSTRVSGKSGCNILLQICVCGAVLYEVEDDIFQVLQEIGGPFRIHTLLLLASLPSVHKIFDQRPLLT